MPTLRQGDSGHRVALIQRIIGADADGAFGPQTRVAVERFQRRGRLLEDGIWGNRTMDFAYRLVEETGAAGAIFGRKPIVRVQLEGVPARLLEKRLSYGRLSLREDAAADYQAAQAELVALGGHMTTAGGTRSLGAKVTRNRSGFSKHYLGRAHDLGVYTGMVDPESDPFIVVQDGRGDRDRYFRVYAAVDRGPMVRLTGLKRSGEVVSCVRKVVDFTALMHSHGFFPIPCRRSTWASVGTGKKIRNPGGLEWWHFEQRPDLHPGESTWGDALMGVHEFRKLRGTGPWSLRHQVYRKDWR